MKTYVVLSDIQYPFHDDKVIKLVLRFIANLQPHGVVLNGDILDCYALSEFTKDPLGPQDLEKEITLAQGLMRRIKESDVKDKWWIDGNHEWRIQRHLGKHADAFRRFGRQATEKAVDALCLKSILDLEKYGFKYKPYGEYVKLGKLIVTHGDIVRKHSGYTARAHMEKYGCSVLVGHTHRLGAHYVRNTWGIHAAYEGGCLCRLDPDWLPYPNWQQGFSVVHVDERTGFFHLDQIPILNGKYFIYGGTKWAA